MQWVPSKSIKQRYIVSAYARNTGVDKELIIKKTPMCLVIWLCIYKCACKNTFHQLSHSSNTLLFNMIYIYRYKFLYMYICYTINANSFWFHFIKTLFSHPEYVSAFSEMNELMEQTWLAHIKRIASRSKGYLAWKLQCRYSVANKNHRNWIHTTWCR